MSVLIQTDEKKDWQVSTGVDGSDHDHCPGCGSDVEPLHTMGGNGGMPHLWSMYSHGMNEGGCGANWTRTTSQGLQRNEERGAQTKWLSTSAATGRVYSLASRAYEEGWERIYGKRNDRN